ncbi:hypothetical protein DFH09DRAFT_1345590 [Mycena vulgaris]|nr:hypothetical protein DFH09DRAFT_1345590 [Mycena vulgaris]
MFQIRDSYHAHIRFWAYHTPGVASFEAVAALVPLDSTADGATTTGTTKFFQHTVLPNLRHLEYAWFKPRPIPLTFLHTLPAPELLTSLSLTVSLSTDFLGEGLRHVPMLEDSILHRALGRRDGCELFTLLTPRDLQPLLDAGLLHISLGYSTGKSFDFDMRVRKATIKRLAEFDGSDWEATSEGWKAEFAALGLLQGWNSNL